MLSDEAIQALFPGCRVRRGKADFGPRDVVNIELERGVWTYDQIKALADGMGTTAINFKWEDDPGYSEYTPGGPDTVTIVVSL